MRAYVCALCQDAQAMNSKLDVNWHALCHAMSKANDEHDRRTNTYIFKCGGKYTEKHVFEMSK